LTQVKERESVVERLAKIEGYQSGLSKRIDALKDSMNQRFVTVDQRFQELREGIDKRFSLLTWTITGWFTILTILMVVFKFIK